MKLHTIDTQSIGRGLGLAMGVFALTSALIPTEAEAATVYVSTGGNYNIGSSQRLGIGLQSGAVSGLSLKYFMTQGTALQIGLGGSPWGIGLNLEYLVHPVVLTQGGALTVPLYLGVGVGMGDWKHGYWGQGDGVANLNVHVPLGIAFQFSPLPIDIFLQVEPGMNLVSYITPTFGATAGARLFF